MANWKMPAMERGLVDNNFPSFIAGIGQVGWCNFSAMFGYANVKDVQYRQTLSNESYMWSYGAGGGGPESASDISSTSNFTTDSLQTIFTMIFGSYFGDWDYPNDFCGLPLHRVPAWSAPGRIGQTGGFITWPWAKASGIPPVSP